MYNKNAEEVQTLMGPYDFSENALYSDVNNDTSMKSQVLCNHENYGVYTSIALDKETCIYTGDITSENWVNHYQAILNILKDGIESVKVHTTKIRITFVDDVIVDLTIPDYFINLIMWNMLISTGTPIQSKHIFFCDEIKKDNIKRYIDNFIDNNRKRFSNKELNNIIDDTLYRFHDIDNFAMYLSNTVNLEDNVFLMDKCKEFYECMHTDLTSVAIEDIKTVGMTYANRAIDIMKDSKQYLGYDHCLADACRASEGINPKQFKEFTINIGTKPDGRGGIFPNPIYNSFINGGVMNPMDYFIESSTGRTAQIIKYNNVGTSGHFARLLGLNNMDSKLHENPNYDCHSTNFLEIVVKDAKTLQMLKNRYYRLSQNGIERQVTNDSDIIGKKIYLRSPITCVSAARGDGVCYKCYGDLAYTVFDAGINFGVNIGRIASETLSSRLTQMLLSVKHLLETFVEKNVWSKEFNDYLEVEGNVIKLLDDIDFKDCKLVIDPDGIELENEEDDDISYSDDGEEGSSVVYNEYISEFDILHGHELYRISNEKNSRLYISTELNKVIRKRGEPIDGKITIDLNELKDMVLFIVPIENNEISKTLEYLESVLNKNSTVKGMDIHQMLQVLIDTVIEGKLNVASVHLEVIMSNQIRDSEDILSRPKWYLKNPPYEILSLNRALTSNPSITVSLSYQKIGKLLYSPLTFKKKGVSFMDLFFMERPQCDIEDSNKPEEFKPTPGELFEPMSFYEDPNKTTSAAEPINLD